jgi:lysyl-tRNA synthetase class 1
MDYQSSKAWPYVEARKIAQRGITGRDVVFECGYGPSGQPHIGTFAEVARTTMVRRAYEDLMGFSRNAGTRLIVFSDDMDALRSVPTNLSEEAQASLAPWLGYSLTRVPDPSGRHQSFAHANNAMLCDFLDRFGFDYEFMSATETYNSGRFNDALLAIDAQYDKVRGIIAPTLGEERRATYSPFMPIMEDGHVVNEGVTSNPNYVGVIDVSYGRGPWYKTVRDDGRFRIVEWGIDRLGDVMWDIRNGNVKCQWKADWAMRWLALGVDYEMAGKDLTDSVTLSSKIVRAIGGRPPVTMIYEMFLDEHGGKISKSKGNGLTMEQWLRYGSQDSLAAYLYREPQRAKKLYPAVVVQAEEDYRDARRRYAEQTSEQRLGNAVHHVHAGVPEGSLPVSYQLLLNIAQTAAVDSKARLHSYASRVTPVMSDALEEELGWLIDHAFNYYEDFLAGKLARRLPTPEEGVAMLDLADRLDGMSLGDVTYAHRANPDGTRFLQLLAEPLPEWAVGVRSGEEMIQFEVYEVGKAHFGKERLRDWFRTLYETVLGQESGPRFGAFTAMYGIRETVDLLRGIANEGSQV